MKNLLIDSLIFLFILFLAKITGAEEDWQVSDEQELIEIYGRYYESKKNNKERYWQKMVYVLYLNQR